MPALCAAISRAVPPDASPRSRSANEGAHPATPLVASLAVMLPLPPEVKDERDATDISRGFCSLLALMSPGVADPTTQRMALIALSMLLGTISPLPVIDSSILRDAIAKSPAARRGLSAALPALLAAGEAPERVRHAVLVLAGDLCRTLGAWWMRFADTGALACALARRVQVEVPLLANDALDPEQPVPDPFGEVEETAESFAGKMEALRVNGTDGWSAVGGREKGKREGEDVKMEEGERKAEGDGLGPLPGEAVMGENRAEDAVWLFAGILPTSVPFLTSVFLALFPNPRLCPLLSSLSPPSSLSFSLVSAPWIKPLQGHVVVSFPVCYLRSTREYLRLFLQSQQSRKTCRRKASWARAGSQLGR